MPNFSNFHAHFCQANDWFRSLYEFKFGNWNDYAFSVFFYYPFVSLLSKSIKLLSTLLYTLYQVESWLGQIQVPLTGKTKLVSDPKEWTNLWSLWKVSFELLSTNYIHYNVRCMNENHHCLLFAWLLALHHHSLHSRNENLKRFYSDDRIHFKQLNNSSKRNTNQSNVISNNCRKWNYLHK